MKRAVALGWLLWIASLGAIVSSAAGQSGSYAIVGGSVFRESGFSLPGASVTLVPKESESAGAAHSKPRKKTRKHEAASDARGEFAFRVPPEPATYAVTAAMKGFQSLSKEVTVSGEERVDVTLVLVEESK